VHPLGKICFVGSVLQNGAGRDAKNAIEFSDLHQDAAEIALAFVPKHGHLQTTKATRRGWE
jgi:hypothetical protein